MPLVWNGRPLSLQAYAAIVHAVRAMPRQTNEPVVTVASLARSNHASTLPPFTSSSPRTLPSSRPTAPQSGVVTEIKDAVNSSLVVPKIAWGILRRHPTSPGAWINFVGSAGDLISPVPATSSLVRFVAKKMDPKFSMAWDREGRPALKRMEGVSPDFLKAHAIAVYASRHASSTTVSTTTAQPVAFIRQAIVPPATAQRLPATPTRANAAPHSTLLLTRLRDAQRAIHLSRTAPTRTHAVQAFSFTHAVVVHHAITQRRFPQRLQA